MKRFLAILGVMFAVNAIAGKDPGSTEYAVSNIPEALMKNANVVKRAEITRFEIKNNNHAEYYQKVAYTILNEEGDRYASFAMGYDKLRSIESIDGWLYDFAGNKIKSLKKSEIKDVTGNNDASLIDDNRLKWHSFYCKAYPFTIEYEVEVKFKGTMFLPDWIPQQRPVMSVQESKLVIITPASNPLQFKMFNYSGQPMVTDDKGNKVYSWEVKAIPAVEDEYARPSWHELTTSVFMATEKFTLDDYQGSNASWKDFGRFVYDLKKGRDALHDEIKKSVHQLTDGIADDKEKVRILYEYMQQNTRYISVQLGVGGWQPFDANYVAANRYGDCKALSNYMFSLLKEAGIRSVYTVIGAFPEDDYLITDLPCSQFNHVVLFVPGNTDTTWLECTSQTMAAGYLGSIGNRFALAVDETGGTLVRTPKYSAKENLEVRHTTAKIDENGNLEAWIKTKYYGEQQDRLHEVINGLSKDKLLEFLKEDIELPSYDLNSFDYKESKSRIPLITETLDLVANNYATVSGKRVFIIPNLITRNHRKLKTDEDRKFDLVLSFEYKDVDSTEIIIPAGLAAESIPQDANVETKFGKYKSSTKVEGDKITYYRSYEHYSGRFPAKDYPELVKFYDTIYKADRSKIVLVKKEASQKAF